MEKFTAVRDGQLDLEFTGEKLGSVTDKDHDNSTTHTLYRTAGGRYVYARQTEPSDEDFESSTAEVYMSLDDLKARVKMGCVAKQLFKESGLPTTVAVDPPKPVYSLESYTGPSRNGGSWNFTLPGVDGLYSTFAGTKLASAVDLSTGVKMGLFVDPDGRHIVSRCTADGRYNSAMIYVNQCTLVDSWSTFDDLTRALLVTGEVVDPKKLVRLAQSGN